MPNILDDGFLDQASVAHQAALIPGNSDFALQGAISNAITTAANSGLFSVGVNISAYSVALVNAMLPRLTNMGFTFSLTSTVLTVSW